MARCLSSGVPKEPHPSQVALDPVCERRVGAGLTVEHWLVAPGGQRIAGRVALVVLGCGGATGPGKNRPEKRERVYDRDRARPRGVARPTARRMWRVTMSS